MDQDSKGKMLTNVDAARITIDFYWLPPGKSQLGRDKLTSASPSGDNFAAFYAVLC